MDWRWNWLWTIIWNMLVHAVFFQWDRLSQDAEDFKNWWRSFWSEIVAQLTSVRNWAQDKINEALGYAYGLYLAVRDWVNSLISDVRNWTQNLVNAVYAWARPYIDDAARAVRSLFEWIQPYRDFITNFLYSARYVIDWLWHQAWLSLQSFLKDPLGFVLGGWVSWLRTIINFWVEHGQILMTFVSNELGELYTLWVNGKSVLKTLVNNPEKFIYDMLLPHFLDWLEQLIADNW